MRRSAGTSGIAGAAFRRYPGRDGGQGFVRGRIGVGPAAPAYSYIASISAAKLLPDGLPLHLGGGGELTAFDRQGPLQDGESLDLPHRGQSPVHLVDGGLHSGADPGRVAPGWATASASRAMSTVRYGRSSPMTTASPMRGRLLELHLDERRVHVLPARGDDDVLLAVGDVQEPVGVQVPDVAGVHEPSPSRTWKSPPGPAGSRGGCSGRGPGSRRRRRSSDRPPGGPGPPSRSGSSRGG